MLFLKQGDGVSYGVGGKQSVQIIQVIQIIQNIQNYHKLLISILDTGRKKEEMKLWWDFTREFSRPQTSVVRSSAWAGGPAYSTAVSLAERLSVWASEHLCKIAVKYHTFSRKKTPNFFRHRFVQINKCANIWAFSHICQHICLLVWHTRSRPPTPTKPHRPAHQSDAPSTPRRSPALYTYYPAVALSCALRTYTSLRRTCRGADLMASRLGQGSLVHYSELKEWK